MSKIKIYSNIHVLKEKGNKICINGIKNNNQITYKDDKCIVNLLIKGNVVHIKRKCDDYTLDLDLELDKNRVTKYYINELNMDIKIETLTNKLIIKNNKISAEYDLYMNDKFSDTFLFNIEWSEL